MPLASVILPVHNAEKFLQNAIQSILNQTYSNIELLVINDASTDSSKEIILSFNDSRIKYIENDTNLGLAKTLNKAIGLCRGKYIVRMDADDVCEPTRIEKQVRFLGKHPHIGMCGSWAKVIDNNGEVTGKIINQTNPKFVKVALLFSVPIVHPSVCFRSSVIKENLYAEFTVAQDYELWSRLSDQTQLANLPYFLLRYRWHRANASNEKQALQRKNKEITIRKELQKLHLDPNEETMRIHQLSFSLYEFGSRTKTDFRPTDLADTAQWFKQLRTSNKRTKRYDKHALTAFLWARWIVLCLVMKKKTKIFFPSFASYHPKVIFYLMQQLNLMAKK